MVPVCSITYQKSPLFNAVRWFSLFGRLIGKYSDIILPGPRDRLKSCNTPVFSKVEHVDLRERQKENSHLSCYEWRREHIRYRYPPYGHRS